MLKEETMRIIKKIGKIIVEGNQVGSSPKKMQIRVIGKDMKACEVNKNMVRKQEGQRDRIIADFLPYVGWK